MSPRYKAPGVYVEEISALPPSIAEVETAVPAFIGYTEKADKKGASLINLPTRIQSLVDYEEYFGGEPEPAEIRVELDSNQAVIDVELTARFYLYNSLRLFFENGGGKCYIVSVGTYKEGANFNEVKLGRGNEPGLRKGLAALETCDEPTILLFPDGVLLESSELASLQQAALTQCSKLQDRVCILDIHDGFKPRSKDEEDVITVFRDGIGMNHLGYGAAYYPWIETTFSSPVDASSLKDMNGNPLDRNQIGEGMNAIVDRIEKEPVVLPPSGAIAGIYAAVDSKRGVWKAPANVSLSFTRRPAVSIDNNEQEDLNVDTVAGKSINAIRAFPRKGTLVWGARTLAGNDNEWRYISVRRFFNLVEESLKKSTAWAVFEPNNANLWTKLKASIENYLTGKWREGALAGSKPEQAFFVNVGLGKTMTAQDILEGRLIVEIGMAVVRPAEFIILRFSHKLQES